MTPLHGACKKGHLPIVKYLISKGANINAKAKNHMEYTPLHFAASHQHPEIVKYLVSIGADKKAKNEYGTIPYNMTFNYDIQELLPPN